MKFYCVTRYRFTEKTFCGSWTYVNLFSFYFFSFSDCSFTCSCRKFLEIFSSLGSPKCFFFFPSPFDRSVLLVAQLAEAQLLVNWRFQTRSWQALAPRDRGKEWEKRIALAPTLGIDGDYHPPSPPTSTTTLEPTTPSGTINPSRLVGGRRLCLRQT